MLHVFLSAGHGGSDPGAVGHGLKEKGINLKIMLACRDELKRHGIKVTTSRTTDANDPVQQEVAEANASGADVAVSFHTNAGGGDGSETYYWAGDSKGLKLASLCEKHTKAIGQNSRGVKAGNGLMFINSTNMTAVLCECGFIDNGTDKKIIDTAAEQKKFGVAYAKAIMEFLGVVPKKATTTKAPAKHFLVRVTANVLNVRKGAGMKYAIATTVRRGEVYTIVETKIVNGKKWGKLKSGAGWVHLGYTKIV